MTTMAIDCQECGFLAKISFTETINTFFDIGFCPVCSADISDCNDPALDPDQEFDYEEDEEDEE